MLKRLIFLSLTFILASCGTGLCPLRTSAGQCSTGSETWSPLIGILDTSFGINGYAYNPVAAQSHSGGDLKIDSSGRIVTVGQACTTGFDCWFTLMRYSKNGIIDTSFGTNGVVIETAAGNNSVAAGMDIQSDGKIIACGRVAGLTNSFYARYHSNGSIDTTFGTAGTTTIDFATQNDGCGKIISLSDGKYLSLGFADVAGNRNMGLMRLNNDGSLDTTFGGTGKVSIDINGTDSIQDGFVTATHYYVGGTANNGVEIALAKLFHDGTLDTTFGTAGKLNLDLTAFQDQAFSFILNSAQKIIFTGYSYNLFVEMDVLTSQYSTDGVIDTTFGTAGIVLTDMTVGSASDQGNSIIEQPDRKYLVGGRCVAPSSKAAILRYNSNGSLDTTFGTGGYKCDSTNLDFWTRKMIQQANGNALFLSSLTCAPGIGWCIARYK